MTIFLTYLVIITALSMITAYGLSDSNKEKYELFLGAFIGYSVIVVMIEAISFVVALISMILFDANPEGFGKTCFILILFYLVFLVLSNKDTK
ncbi:hypothetical protein [Escherichia coli]|uniref:hypothetical protein n=1 Tax=Escherichia coli TaxID=562 RepID=UPI0013EE7ED9|nr:hypothetical protein [Escherichia coli]EFP9273010.1 hypothetical protein [Shigella sonnei]EEX4309396.1 hypothetical protein [Escherichia coli]EEZ7690133.1 hypothetical protein [Escherichia coli]EFC6906864.1 hypothetical protein [Escherichia coli]EFF0709470.1 hypothetical protein [Escherichia coli]